jgi:hypothetical protein
MAMLVFDCECLGSKEREIEWGTSVRVMEKVTGKNCFQKESVHVNFVRRVHDAKDITP